jgi:hypothetical protein
MPVLAFLCADLKIILVLTGQQTASATHLDCTGVLRLEINNEWATANRQKRKLS